MGLPFYHPNPKPKGERYKKVIPEVKANPISRITFSWMFPLLKTGYTRPLEIEDIWHLDDARLTKEISDTLERNFFERCAPEYRPMYLGGIGYGKDREALGLNEKVSKDKVVDSSAGSTIGRGSSIEEVKVIGSNDGVEIDEKADGLLNNDDLRQEAAEQSIIADVDANEFAADLPPATRTLSLGFNASGTLSKEHLPTTLAEDVAEQQTDIKVKQAQMTKSLNPYINYRRAKKLAKGKLVQSKVDGKMYDQSLTMALHDSNRNRIWLAAACQICSGVLQSTSSLVTKKLISYISQAHAYHIATEAERALMAAPPSVGYGIGVAFGLALMQEAASLFSNQFFVQSMGAGWMMRASLIDQISRKSLRLSGKARLEMTNGRLTTSVSGDCSFLDFAAPMAVECFTQPITIAIGMALLLYNLGYSALVGLAVLVGSTPVLALLFAKMIGSRQAQMKIVDQRVRLLSEVMNNIRAIKLYAYESYFGKKLSNYRARELARLRFNVRNRATMISTMTFMPTLAAVLTFITYGLSGHTLNAATIFAGLQLFNIISGPMRILPMAFTAVSDAHVAITRIGTLLLADELPTEIKVDPNAKYAIQAEGDFTFESAKPPDAKGGPMTFANDRDRKAVAAKKKAKKEAKERKKKGLPTIEDEKKEGEGVPFQLRNISLQIPRGALVCVVGRIGSGKSALLQALIGEMRATRGEVVFGGPLSYFQQTPWVQNCSLRENIVFGEDEVDEERLERTIRACALQSDIDILGDGLGTEIGERGINLSGGQKARVCLARCVYFDSDVVLLDDPLAAVDSHVAHHLLEECILGALGDKTRVLITHHLEVLPHADYILVMEDGQITQQGAYEDLRRAGGTFTDLMDEYGQSADANEDEEAVENKVTKKKVDAKDDEKKEGSGVKLMQDEERNTGSVSWKVYTEYAKAMGANGWLFLAGALLVLSQCCQVGNTLFLGFWSGNSIKGFQEGDYMAIYASFGVAQALLTFLASYTISLAGLRASFLLFNRALNGVLRSPILFHDSTPIGRIISRLSKDIEMIDDRLTFQWYQFLSNALSVLGTIALVIYTYQWLGLIFIPLAVLYYVFAEFYRKTSREVKRIDSNTRSFIYSSFGEQLTGMASIRAYRQQDRFEGKLQRAVDKECRCYYSTIILQRWLGVRLDLLGNVLVLGIGIFGVAFRNSVSPSKLGVVLTYSLQATQVFSQLVNIFAQVEQEMNNVERVTYYGDLPQEAAPTLPTDPPADWPQHGHLKFSNVQMRYREGLPLVLKGVSFEAMPGEKIGIVGRTGAGKSSLAQALFRIVELAEGNIEIDGVDLRNVGLDTLRTRLSAIPQDALLYGGTMRENLDPTGQMTDAELHDALRRCDLIPPPNAPPQELARFEKFKLDAVVSDDGSNFSGGERQLVALTRAVVKNSRVILLDEATSSVDPETDASIQRTIRNEFTSQTLLCIAHRLATIAFYDRILVLDFGEVKEFDTPLNLYDSEDSIFRSMCEAARLTREQIVRIRDNHGTPFVTRPGTPAAGVVE